jgi:hypothetical protein
MTTFLICVLALALIPALLWAPPGILHKPSAQEAGATFNRMITALPRGCFRIIGADTVFVYHRTVNGTGIRVGCDLIVNLTTPDAK